MEDRIGKVGLTLLLRVVLLFFSRTGNIKLEDPLSNWPGISFDLEARFIVGCLITIYRDITSVEETKEHIGKMIFEGLGSIKTTVI